MTTPNPAQPKPKPPFRPEPGSDASIDEIERDITQTRQELGETVEALAEKLDVKKRAQHAADDAKARVAHQIDEVKDTAGHYYGQAKDAVTDSHGRPNRNGWIGIAVAAAAAVTALVLIIRNAQR